MKKEFNKPLSLMLFFMFDMAINGAVPVFSDPLFARPNQSHKAVSVVELGACVDRSDASEKINTALASYAGKGAIWVPPGVICFVARPLHPQTNSHLTIDGTIFQMAASRGNKYTIDVAGAVSNITIDGSGVIDGNKSNISESGACINIYNGVSHTTIRDIKIQKCKNFPVNAWHSVSHIYLSHLEITSSGNSTEFADGCDNCWADHLNIHDTSDYGFSFYGGATNSRLTNSRIYKASSGGVSVLADKFQPGVSSKIVIAGNTFSYNAGAAISVVNSVNSSLHKDINVLNNASDHNNQNNLPGYGGLYANHVDTLHSNSNTFHHDGNGKSSSVGVNFGGLCNRCSTTNDTIYDEGIGGTSGVGIQIARTATATNVTHDRIFDDQPQKTMAFAINGSLDNNSHNTVSYNSFGKTIGRSQNLILGNDTVSVGNTEPNSILLKR